MILEGSLRDFKGDEIFKNLKEAGGLTAKELTTILEYTTLVTKDHVDDVVEIIGIIEPLLMGALYLREWPGYTPQKQKRRISDFLDDESFILAYLNRMTLYLMTLYKSGEPYKVHNVFLGWKIFFFTLFRISHETADYKFSKNLYYSSIVKWLNYLEDNYCLEKLTLRMNLLPSNYVATDKAISTKMNDKKIKIDRAFPDFLVHNNKYNLAKKLKQEFKSDYSKKIRILIEALKSYDPPLLVISSREQQALYDSMQSFFNQDIGTYTSIWDLPVYNKNREKDQSDLKLCKIRIDGLLKSLDSAKTS